MKPSKFVIFLLMTILWGFANDSRLYAGNVTANPKDDGSGNIFISEDGNVTFTAKSSANNGTTTIDPSSDFGDDGTPSNYTGTGGTGTVVVTYDDDATGSAENCSLIIDHKDSSGKTCSSASVGLPVKFTVFVPQLQVSTVASSTQPDTRTTIGIGEEVGLSLLPTNLPNPQSIFWINTGSGKFENNKYSGMQLLYQAYCEKKMIKLRSRFQMGLF
jgi:hypothetical protein